jgi:hypothetical protein
VQAVGNEALNAAGKAGGAVEKGVGKVLGGVKGLFSTGTKDEKKEAENK